MRQLLMIRTLLTVASIGVGLASLPGCHIGDRTPPSAPVRGLSTKGKVPAHQTAMSAAHIPHNNSIYPVSRMPNADGVVQASHTHQCNGACCRTASYTPTFPEYATSYSCNTHTPQPDFGMMGCGTGCSPVACAPPALPQYIDTNEYVYDGGDRDPQVRLRDDLSVVGLNSEDTVIQYETQSGSMEVKSGCRVPIYAPRFAAARKIRSLGFQDHVVATKAALLQEKTGGMQETLPPTGVRLKQGPVRGESVHVVESYRDRQKGLNFEKVLPVVDISDAFKPYEDLAIIREGKMIMDDKIKLRRFASAAMSWTNLENLRVIVDGQAAALIEESQGAEEVLVYELDGKPRVRLCKVASHQVAESGDTIDFTIRFDNIGDQKVSNIVVRDSLSPRLEYVEETQKCSLKSEFHAEPNEAGSSILAWTILEEVKAGTGGYIRFQCKVR